jgi:hypothetical protein
VIKLEEMPGNQVHSSLSIDAQLRIRDELHSVQVGLNLLRKEMLSGDFRGADLTYATIQHCLCRLSDDAVLATTRDAATS